MSSIGIKQLMDERNRIIAKWEKSGLLDGLTGNINDDCASIFEGNIKVDLTKYFAKLAEEKWIEGELNAYHAELKNYLSS